MNAAMTLDGKVVTAGGDSRISCEEDLDRLHRLRSEVDAVIVGAGTILADDPSLTVRRVPGKNPVRVVVDGRGRIPLTARVLRDGHRTIVAVSSLAGKGKVEAIRETGAEVWVFRGRTGHLGKLLERLHGLGVRRVLLEGGPTLNWEMLREGLVDEVRVSVAPVIVGGEGAKTLVEGRGFRRVMDGIRLSLVRIERVGEDLLLVYRVGERFDQGGQKRVSARRGRARHP